jgi:prepilin-type N-terminal cleavage/methylation domain-containing protein
MKKKAFTLIELLVVIAIIALLLSILLPALRRVKVQAKIVLCKSNLHQWGLAWGGYNTENDNKIPETYAGYGGRYPANIQFDNKLQNGFFSVEMIKNYLPGANITRNTTGVVNSDSTLNAIWTCPSNSNKEDFDAYVQAGSLMGDGAFFIGMYAFYGRSDLWEDSAFRLKELAGRGLSSQKLLMSDVLYRWNVSGGLWAYNHATDGGRVHQYGKLVSSNPYTITGVNHLYGDLSVEWKKADDFDLDAMHGASRSIPSVYGGGTDVSDY